MNNNTNKGNIQGLRRFFELKTQPKNELRNATNRRHVIIESYLSKRTGNFIKTRQGSIRFDDDRDVYMFLKGLYIDIVHDAKNNNKPSATNKNNNKNNNTGKKSTAISAVIDIIGNFADFIETYFNMIYSMNQGKGAFINSLKISIIQSATEDTNFYNETAKYFKSHFENTWKDEVFKYTGYTDTGPISSPEITRRYKVSNSNHEYVYYDMESTGDVSRKINIEHFPLILSVPGASDAGIMMTYSLQPYKQLGYTLSTLQNAESTRKLLNNTYQKSLSEIEHIINSNIPQIMKNNLHNRIYRQGTVPPRTSSSQLAKFIINSNINRRAGLPREKFGNWALRNPMQVDTLLDFRPVSCEYKYKGIIIYKLDYIFDPNINVAKQSVEKKFIQSCTVSINNEQTDPVWSSGPQAWKFVKGNPNNPAKILALLRKESMDRGVYTLALLNNSIHITGDISAMSNRTLLYKIYGDTNNTINYVPKTALFDHGRAGASLVELRKRPNNRRYNNRTTNFSNAPSQVAIREAIRTAMLPLAPKILKKQQKPATPGTTLKGKQQKLATPRTVVKRKQRGVVKSPNSPTSQLKINTPRSAANNRRTSPPASVGGRGRPRSAIPSVRGRGRKPTIAWVNNMNMGPIPELKANMNTGPIQSASIKRKLNNGQTPRMTRSRSARTPF